MPPGQNLPKTAQYKGQKSQEVGTPWNIFWQSQEFPVQNLPQNQEPPFSLNVNQYLKLLIQDVTAFSGEKFDLKDWVNKTFSQQEAQHNKEVKFVSCLTAVWQFVSCVF